MRAWLLRGVLRRLHPSTLLFALDGARDAYLAEIGRVEEAATKTQEALGAVMFVAGQHLAVVSSVREQAKQRMEKV